MICGENKSVGCSTGEMSVCVVTFNGYLRVSVVN